MFSKKATRIYEIFIVNLTLCSICQINCEDIVNFFGLPRNHELLLQNYNFFCPFQMQNIKKEPETEPLSERTDGQDAETDKVPEDVSLNTPMSKHDEADDGNGSADENNENDKKAATVNNSDKTEAEIEEGGDLEGSVTAESPQGNFDSDDENQDQDKSERGPVNGNSASEQTGSASFNKPETGLGMKETSAEEDLLTSTEATSMEEGDEQYKNMIAETQMENIFN